MNEPVKHELYEPASDDRWLNVELSAGGLSEEFRKGSRLRVHNFLSVGRATSIYQQLARSSLWRTFIVSNQQLLATPGSDGTATAEDDREALDCAIDGARNGFASLYDADDLYPEDFDAGHDTVFLRVPVLVELENALNQASMLSFLARVTGVREINRVSVHATRFRPGHFVTFNSATMSADKTGKRCGAFYLNLTPQWKPEWGGMLEFRAHEPSRVEAFIPTFNSLDIFSFPHGHWISPISPFAFGPMLAVAGRMYVG